MTSALARAWLQAAAPPPSLTVSEWAGEHRRLPETSAARGARWRNETCPYLVDFMNAPLERGIKQLTLMKASQLGASEALTNVIGYFMQHRPCPILMVQPTASAAQAYAKERLASAIQSTPALRAIVSDKRVPSSEGLPESTLALKVFPAGYLALCGANTPNTFARWSVRLAIMDDADRVPRHVGSEGDPALLLAARTTAWRDGLSIFVSTPTLAGGRIETLFGQGDQRRYHLPCVSCGVWDFVSWNDATRWRVAFDGKRAATARLEHSCGAAVSESERLDLVRAGEWRPTAEPLAPGFVSFHVPAMLSPFVTLTGLATKFLAANVSGPRRLKEFINGSLGESWEDEVSRLDPASLVGRMEDY